MMTVDEAEKVLGVELMPWQRELAQAILDGKEVVYVRTRRVGYWTVRRIVGTAWASEEGNA